MSGTRTPEGQRARVDAAVRFRHPTPEDGATMWRIARDSGALDLNSPYAYLMWAGQFADSSILAEVDGKPAGFLTGFHPPGRERVLFVWQVAVDASSRGLGLASRMLDELVERTGAAAVEATVTPSNRASRRLFRSLAERHDCACEVAPCLEPGHFPEPGHEAEQLFHIGPIRQA